MALELYWGSGSPYAWRVLLALEHKRLPYESHLLQFSKQEHKSPQMLKMNFRGQVPVIKDGDYVCFESLAILYYLDLKYPDPPIFGLNPEEAGTIMRVICEYQSYAEIEINRIVRTIFDGGPEGPDPASEEITRAAHLVGGEARTIEQRLSKSDWVVGERFSAADMVIFPGIQLLLRAMSKPAAAVMRSRFLPLDVYYPAIARWIQRVETLPGYERTYPPHWREVAATPIAPVPAGGHP
ncbi:MAG TPA: glutathione S-transferase family protein [Steroidobacteraceae bacterium]|nr:glutathione S-transferase family protein [Steroidobacteraceae bacterium]